MSGQRKPAVDAIRFPRHLRGDLGSQGEQRREAEPRCAPSPDRETRLAACTLDPEIDAGTISALRGIIAEQPGARFRGVKARLCPENGTLNGERVTISHTLIGSGRIPPKRCTELLF